MKDLEKIILDFRNWERPWTFHPFVLDSHQLNEVDKKVFSDIWMKASVPEIWNHADLILGMKGCQIFIKQNYDVSDDAIGAIVRAMSYDWK